MRWQAIALALFGVACGHDSSGSCTYQGHVYAIGDQWALGDNCNYCTCTASGPACTARACVDSGTGSAAACAPSGGCPSGPVCGALCCGAGEKCDNGTCKCGTAAACGAGDSCAAAGPIGGDACGAICCGATGPCPQ